MKKQIILGPPGTGKTTRLLKIIEEALAAGVSPERISYVSFTTAATDEAIDRATVQYGIKKKQMPYFRTLHSMGFQTAGIRRTQVLSWSDYDALSRLLGYRVDVTMTDWTWENIGIGAKHQGLYNLARAQCRPLEEVWVKSDREVDWWQLKRFADTYEQYKRSTGKVDFADMLSLPMHYGVEPLDVDIAIIDEGQDLSEAQWRFAEALFANCAVVIVAGDDDQAVYAWSGASVERFLALEGEVEVLEKSWRLPEKVHRITQQVSSRIKNRRSKVHTHNGSGGNVFHYTDSQQMDVGEGDWLMLVREKKRAVALEDWLRTTGYPHLVFGKNSVNHDHVLSIRAYEHLRKGGSITAERAEKVLQLMGLHRPGLEGEVKAGDLGVELPVWHESMHRMEGREHYLALLRKGYAIDSAPTIRISSIHGAKGAEAENVMLLTDLSGSTQQSFERNPDDEHRVWYVGLSRAKEALHLISPYSENHYPVPT